MKPVLAIYRRELRAFFASPVAYVVIIAWLYVCGLSYWAILSFFADGASSGGSDNPLAMFFGGTILFWLPLLVFVPVLTMRLLAGERASGTLEALLTTPVTATQVVAGKYLAGLTFWVALWVPTLFFVVITAQYGDVDPGAVAASYLGLFGIGVFYVAAGLLGSALAPTQVVAAVLTFFFIGALFILGILQFVTYDLTRDVLAYLSVWTHMSDFAKGVVDTRYLVFYASAAALALFLAVRALAWRPVK